MYRQAIKSGAHKAAVVFVSITMVVSLALPLSALAANNTDSSSTTLPTSRPDPSVSATPDNQNPQPSSASTMNSSPTSSSQPATAPPQTTVPAKSNQEPSSPSGASSGTASLTAPKSSQSTTNNAADSSINSEAVSGGATATKNTSVGDIATGDAAAMATIVNLLQSNVNLNGTQPITFVKDVTGTVKGDLLIDPGQLSQSTAASLARNTTPQNSLDAALQASITNNLDVKAVSGGATATKNTSVGDIQTGSADAIANVINLINSAISANQSFIGVVNIYGDLQGNILVPADFVNSVLGTGSALGATNGAITTTDSRASVINDVTTSASSGSITATNNSSVGDVVTGKASTNVTIFNLTSSQTTGKNALLVFVNVLGTWVGLILDAPAGTTSASLGGNAATQANSSLPTNINSNNDYQITNHITVASQSGDAIADKNSTVGNIRTGDALAGANLLNILNSQISLSDWFGVLFINVFGNWTGNFGAQKIAATPSSGGGTNNTTGSNSPNSSAANSRSNPTYVFSFEPNSSKKQHYAAYPFKYNRTAPKAAYNGFVLSSYASFNHPKSNNVGSDSISLQSGNKEDAIENQSFEWWIPGLGLLIVAALISGRYYIVRRHKASQEL